MNSKAYVNAKTISDHQVLSRILAIHISCFFTSYSISSIRAVRTTKKCQNEGCNNTADFAVTQVFGHGRYYTFYICGNCMKKAYLYYASEVVAKIDEALSSVKNRELVVLNGGD